MKTFFYTSKLSRRKIERKKGDIFFCLYLFLFRKICHFILFILLSGEKKLKNQSKTQNYEVKKTSHAFIREKLKSQTVKLDMNNLLI